MKRNLFTYYALLAPAVLAPLTLWLWWQVYGDWPRTLNAWVVPVLWAYIVPGVGTNILKVWAFDTQLKLGNFRPQHGFVFGSATAFLAWCAHTTPATHWVGCLQSSFILAAVLGFWNILYDIAALKTGVLHVYNPPWAKGEGVEAIAHDYAPWFFGGFGAAYGLSLAGFEWWCSVHGLPSTGATCAWLLCALLFSIAVPVFGFMQHSLRKHGHAGTRPMKKEPLS